MSSKACDGAFTVAIGCGPLSLNTWYPVTVGVVDAFQVRSISVGETAVAWRFVGGATVVPVVEKLRSSTMNESPVTAFFCSTKNVSESPVETTV